MAGFTIKRPDEKRRTYQVYIKKYVDGGAKYERVVDERLDSINHNIKLGSLPLKLAEIQLGELIKRMKSEQGMVPKQSMVRAEINSMNLKAFEKYFQAEYDGKKMVRPHQVEQEFMFALKHLNDISLYTVDRSTLQKICDKAFDTKQHKRYVSRINALLDFIGRGFSLHLKATPHQEILYVTFEELEKILEHVEDPELKALYITLFATGTRLGEAFTLDSRSLKPNGSIWVSKQMDNRTLDIRELKNKKPHHALLLKEFQQGYKLWVNVDDKSKHRKWAASARLTEAAMKAFPKDKSKHISPHDLRHSYVIELLSRGVSLDRCARLIGDTLAACEKSYAGFDMKSNEIEAVKQILAAY